MGGENGSYKFRIYLNNNYDLWYKRRDISICEDNLYVDQKKKKGATVFSVFYK